VFEYELSFRFRSALAYALLAWRAEGFEYELSFASLMASASVRATLASTVGNSRAREIVSMLEGAAVNRGGPLCAENSFGL